MLTEVLVGAVRWVAVILVVIVTVLLEVSTTATVNPSINAEKTASSEGEGQ